MSTDWNEWFAPMTKISQGPFTSPGLTTTYFGIQASGNPGASYISSIEFWWRSDIAKRTTVGNFKDVRNWPTAKHQRFELQGGERIKRMSISVNNGEGFNGVSLTTIFGREWTCSCTSKDYQRWHDVDVGSGLLVGARSTQNIFPFGFAFAFLKPVKSLALTNVVYTTTPTDASAPIHMVDYMSKSFPNNTDHETDWEVSESSTDEQSFEWTVGLAVGLSMTASVSAGFFDIVEVNEFVTWSIDASVSTTNKSTESKTVAWKTSGHVGAKKEVEVMLRYGKGSFKSGYTGTLHVEMESGASINIPCKGSFAQTVVGVEQAAATEKSSAH